MKMFDLKGDTLDPVIRKGIAGMVSLFVIMCLILFLPGLTFHYWQAWVFLAAFFVPTILITVYLAKHDRALLDRRSSAGPGAEKETKQKVIQGIAQTLFIGLMLIPAFDHRFHWSDVPVYLVLASDLLIMGSFYMIHLVFRENSYTSAIIEVGEDQMVISTGPYRVVRHPMYAGAMPLILCTPLALGSYWGILAVVPLICVIIARLLDEERYLKARLKGYEEYCRKVRYRLIPYIW